jgi:CheY-like chemotaxis protein
MEAIGTLAGGIAHDFNNILSAIIGYASLAQMDLEDPSALRESLAQVLKAGERAKELVSQILSFSRPHKQERRPLRLQPVVKEALKLLRSILPATIEIVCRIEDTAPLVLAEPTQIHQVLMNLCTNAAHAIGAVPGRLEVILAAAEVDTATAQAHPDLRAGPYARLTVSDTGHGMDAATLKRIFEPFFTTKPPEEGTGLGLALVHGIMLDHEGAIRVTSEPGHGTAFELYFPAHESDRIETDTPVAKPPKGQGQHILLVDDESVLAKVAALVLERFGYKVTAETNPLQALNLFRQQPQDYDLVLTDLTMPKMTGVDLAVQVLRIRPRIPILVATGYSTLWNSEVLHRLGIQDMILKPFTPAVLAAAVARALHGDHEPATP